MSQVFQVELYPIPLPPSCEKLRQEDLTKGLAEWCVRRQVPEVEDGQLELTSYLKHVEVVVESGFIWEACADLLKERFTEMVWSGVGVEKTGNLEIYSFEFLPVSLSDDQAPVAFTLPACLHTRYHQEGDDTKEFIAELTEVISEPECWKSSKKTKSQAKENAKKEVTYIFPDDEPEEVEEQQPTSHEVKVSAGQFSHYTAKDLPKLVTELKNERNAKERMALANQKMEILMAQVEHYNMNQAIEDLSISADYDDEDWSKWLKIDLREYTILMQKARFLEQLWVVNRELETRAEKMTISESELTYEREQVKRLKARLTTHEVYLVLDECQEIQKRCKIRPHPLFRKPFVRIMQMDYENLRRKAQYFDFLQGENTLLEKSINNKKAQQDKKSRH